MHKKGSCFTLLVLKSMGDRAPVRLTLRVGREGTCSGGLLVLFLTRLVHRNLSDPWRLQRTSINLINCS